MPEAYRDVWRRGWISDRSIDDPVLLEFLHVLHSHMSRSGRCWPSKGTIAREMRRDRSTAIRKANAAIRLGLIEEDGFEISYGHQCRAYQASGTRATSTPATGVAETPEVVARVHRRGSHGGHPNQSRNQSSKPMRASARSNGRSPCPCGDPIDGAGDLCQECMALRFQGQPYGDLLR